jgi:hypothetical protein
MRGLDPRIHLLEKMAFTRMIDGRVKPGHDVWLLAERQESHALSYVMPRSSRRAASVDGNRIAK